MYRNFKIVPNIIFGRGSFNQLGDILRSKRQGNNSQMVFVLDDVFSGKELEKKLPLETNDLLLPVSVIDEPKTSYIDKLVAQIKAQNPQIPAGIIGIGGGSAMDIAKAVADTKAGKVEYRLDKTNIIHVIIGKASFTEEALKENMMVLLETVKKAKPAAAKGQYFRSVTLASTMSPGVKVNTGKI